MATGNRPTKKTAKDLMNIPLPYWEELLGEMETFKTLYRKIESLPPEKREKALQDLLSSLIHLMGHLKVIYEDAEF